MIDIKCKPEIGARYWFGNGIIRIVGIANGYVDYLGDDGLSSGSCQINSFAALPVEDCAAVRADNARLRAFNASLLTALGEIESYPLRPGTGTIGEAYRNHIINIAHAAITEKG